MPAQLTTKSQVNGYRFMVRRMEHALVRRDVRMLDDPMRSQSRALTVGIVLALLVLGGCGVLALFKPQAKMGDAKIVVGKDSGAMFVVVDGRLHPVLNLASARLVVGSAVTPQTVKDSELGSMARGPLVGIPGAPELLPNRNGQLHSAWTVCDTISDGSGSGSAGSALPSGATTTTVIAGKPDLGDGIGALAPGNALLVTDGRTDYLIYDGKRAAVDLRDTAVTHALQLDGITPRPVSSGLLNAVPEALPIVPPRILDMGRPSSTPIPGLVIGSVFSTSNAGATQYYVLLRDGMEKISQATADLIRYTNTQGGGEIPSIAPRLTAGVPSVTTLAVDSYPSVAPTVVDAKTSPVSCLSWNRDADAKHADLTVLTGNSLPTPPGAQPVALIGADTGAGRLDEFYMPPGKAAFVSATGGSPDAGTSGPLFLVSDTGVRYGIADPKTAQMLGLGDKSDPAPWPILSLLPQGPALTRTDALVTHDGMSPDPAPGKLEVKETSGS
ncbi:type VII secretion protein EccB [Speluncibacter jeojiensis]|uniref:Type VII secretion protein EccB n=1 Tax=Speluncibacter jeojiensis TaxID=2710754 RepID=A0A9X4M3D1_9ACTN|nr:type VII secretion protein EccB [Corynebacteriales bacterium D3-21]